MQTIPKPARAAAVPKTSRAAAIDRFGGPEVLALHTLPVPDLDANEVLIRLDTAGVGVWDADMRLTQPYRIAPKDRERTPRDGRPVSWQVRGFGRGAPEVRGLWPPPD